MQFIFAATCKRPFFLQVYFTGILSLQPADALDWNEYDIPPLLAAEHAQCVKEHRVIFFFLSNHKEEQTDRWETNYGWSSGTSTTDLILGQEKQQRAEINNINNRCGLLALQGTELGIINASRYIMDQTILAVNGSKCVFPALKCSFMHNIPLCFS